MSLEHLADFIVQQVGDTWVIDANRVKVCLTCGALIPQGAHAVHVRWHAERDTGSSPGRDGASGACSRCSHDPLDEHGVGGCTRCGCSSPFGGLT